MINDSFSGKPSICNTLFTYIGAGIGFLAMLAGICGLCMIVQCSTTGPCAGKGGVQKYAQDYIYCTNGARVTLPHDDSSHTSTYGLDIKSR